MTRASYRNPDTGTRVGVDAERVTAVISQPDGTDTVVAMRGSTRTTYRGVLRDTCRVGDELDEPPAHRTHSRSMTWSPFDGEDDDD